MPAHMREAPKELQPLPELGADFRIFDEYADINENLKKEIEALPLDEQVACMHKLARVLAVPEGDEAIQRVAEKITSLKDLDEVYKALTAPPPLPPEDKRETRVFSAAKGIKAATPSGVRLRTDREPEALTVPLPAATSKRKQPQDRGSEEKTRVLPSAKAKKPPAAEKKHAIYEVPDEDVREWTGADEEALRQAIHKYKGKS